jgi:uncharacterized protein (TIGR00730 family)
MNITVFGGSQTQPEDMLYQEAHRLGYLLGSNGHTVLTGGYIGVMEAVSQGAAEAGGHVIGITCDEIEAWRPIGPNKWVQEERRYPTLKERLFALIEGCDAALAMPGGIGTLAEVAMMWSQMQSNAIHSRPLILIGPGWRSTFQAFYSALGDFIPDKYRPLLTFVNDIDSAIRHLGIVT